MISSQMAVPDSTYVVQSFSIRIVLTYHYRYRVSAEYTRDEKNYRDAVSVHYHNRMLKHYFVII